jgi:YfiH family protein
MAEDFVTVPVFEAVPGLVHAFGRRARGRVPETREETARRVSATLETAGTLLLLRQVHGAAVAEAPWQGQPEADASVATRRGPLLGIQTADCMPLLLVDPRRGSVAAAHAGWRGTAAGVARAAARSLVARGSRTEDLLAALGPGIGPCCYEVGNELRAAFGDEGREFFRSGPRGKPHLDVRAANVSQLLGEGLPAASIYHVAECTYCRPDLYHSFRRDGQGGGRMISYVGFRR